MIKRILFLFFIINLSYGFNLRKCQGNDVQCKHLIGGCRGTRYGCCLDGVTIARSEEDPCKHLIGGCKGTRYGCCLDGVTIAKSDRDECLLAPLTEINGSYCGNIYGNVLEVDFNSSLVNIRADVFGDRVQCLNEEYLYYRNGSVVFSHNQSDCLNRYLNEYNACPCPPKMTYNASNRELNILNLPIGTLILNSC